MRTFFVFLCDKLDKKEKFKFVKNIDGDSASTKDYINKFDRHKKLLLYHFIILLENINDERVLEPSMELIFEFLNNNLYAYLKDFDDIIQKSIFFHLFESKSIFNNFFHFCINNEILKDEEFTIYIIGSIKNINKILLLYHPNHYINSYIKNLIKYECRETFLIINHVSETFFELMKLEDSKSNNIVNLNIIKFISTLLKAFQKYSNNLKKLLAKNYFELFYCIQNFVSEMAQNELYYSPNLYIKSSKEKLINKEIIYLSLFEISINSIYLLWRAQDEDKSIIGICIEYISKISQNMIIDGNFITYYLDLINPYFIFNNKNLIQNIPENINKNIQNF